MPVLPLHVHDRLAFEALVEGLVSGAQFAASSLSRPWAAIQADSQGGIKTFNERLLAAGKLKKVALVAAMRKMLTVLKAIAKSGKHWEDSLHNA